MEKDNIQQEIQGSFLHVHFASLMNHIHHSVSGEDEKFQETCEKRRGSFWEKNSSCGTWR